MHDIPQQNQLFPVNPEVARHALVNAEQYRAMYERSQRDPDGFWAEQAKRLEWIKFPTRIKNTSFTGNVDIKWYEDGTLNASASCLDKHLSTRGDQVAIIWEGDDPNDSKSVTYRELHDQVCRLANVLKSMGVKKGDRVAIYLPMVIEAAVAMLACARIGAIHSIVFGGFSPDSLANRVQDCRAEVLITADEGRRGGRKVALKTNADEALKECPAVKHVIVANVTGGKVPMQEGRDQYYDELLAKASPDCKPEEMNAEDPLFILYTSGSTGKPKGALHTTAGYLVWAAFTHELVFDYHPGDIYWCTADVGWVTGHTYIVYGPL
ncbi:MAG: AMP-binding protein, partial [Acetobacteraceae bacterium]|nr:AMP-binding protein [Acetobacteraceae bacterium]